MTAVHRVKITMRGFILEFHPDAPCSPPPGERRFLVGQRAHDDTFMPGRWEALGGKVELGELPFEGWGNECEQETGLLTKPVLDISMTIRRRGTFEGDDPKIIFEEDYGLYFWIGGSPRKSDEHADLRWVTYSEFRELNPVPASAEAAAQWHQLGYL